MIVVDASVALKWFVAEPDSDTALALFRSEYALLSPDHALGEIGEVLVRHCRRGGMTAQEVRRASDAVVQRLAFRSPLPLMDLAATIALEASTSFYDALYVAAAELWHVPLVTADARLANSLASTPWRSRLVLLRDWHDRNPS